MGKVDETSNIQSVFLINRGKSRKYYRFLFIFKKILDYPRGKGWKRKVKSSELMHTLFSNKR